MYFIALSPATVPSYTAFDICKSPPVQSPHANTPFRFVCIFSFTIIWSFFVKIPSFFAKSAPPATPWAINMPSIFKFVPSLNSTFSNLSFPCISCISFVSTSTFCDLTCKLEFSFFPFVSIVILFAKFINSFTSDIA